MLDVKKISAGYGRKKIIDDISFGVSDGECLAVIGPNGCGKTTLLRALCGILRYDGEVEVNGEEISSLKGRSEVARRIAVMPQLSTCTFDYTVREAVEMGRYIHFEPFDSDERGKTVVEDCLEALGLKEISERKVTELSGGQLQRVFLARIFAQEPSVILLDEPTNHLDISYRLELLKYIKEWLKGEKRSVVGVFHDLGIASEAADRMLLLNGGNTAFLGETANILHSDILTKVYGFDVCSYMKSVYGKWYD